ncbi:conserved protein of unknown function [Candidatus Filomicrobium marinum]|uniref:Transfer Agent n=1 Tax=Candidatus Filomicrobium marinum TaxID=1608628 RepID=A0A0D6JK54_9HYPH|nr:gene transfer agent family protein [Candidatus Filomicrobium marinum]CFX31496.1 conserved protein of unknown function [Candidatus Filomicrobium marinum]CPR22020.1 conserved protein of unknown function [Candidatus Filomicrobium marinum]
MANRHRGEIEAQLDGKAFTLCLTLGALAELEAVFGHDDMVGLASRFERGRISARDAQRVIGAGLRGAGYDISDAVVASMQAEGGAAVFVDIVARLLSVTFGGSEGTSSSGEPEPQREAEGIAGVPFPGTR